MGRVAVSVQISASPSDVWESVRHIASHVDWMADAAEIRFTSATTEGVGTTFECLTKVGPIRLMDRMKVTEWIPEQVMGVRHVGLVTGTGKFMLRALPGGRTDFHWEEDLIFPWWMGGRFGGIAGSAVMARIWKRNLKKLKNVIETTPLGPSRPAHPLAVNEHYASHSTASGAKVITAE